MLVPALLLWSIGCNDAVPDDSGNPGPTLPQPTAIGTVAEPFNACELTSAAHGISAVEVGPDNGVIGRFDVAVELSLPGHVQARCVADDEPLDVHWAESDAVGLRHDLVMAGLLPTTDYACQVVPVCPDATELPTDFVLPWSQALLSGLPTPTVERHLERSMVGTYTLMSFFTAKDLVNSKLVILDPLGDVRWSHELGDVGIDIEAQWADGRVLWGGGGFTGRADVGIVDLAGQQLYTAPPWDTLWDHHVELRDDGTLFGLAADPVQIGPQLHNGFQLVHWDPTTDEVLWEWHSIDAANAGTLTHDYAHSNWATLVDTDDGQRAYVSLCELQQLIRIDVATGALDWTLGVGGDFALVDTDGTPLPDDDLPQCQHGPDVDGDRILMMDNGRERAESRGLELVLDETDWTATRTWSWTRDGWFNDILGDADDLGSDHVLLVNGTAQGIDQEPWIAEVHAPSGEIVWEARFRAPDWVYRVERLDGCEAFANSRYCPELVDALRGGPAL